MNQINRAELPLLETALLWAMRAWVIGYNRNINTHARIIKMFESLKAPEAAFRLDGFMNEIRAGARRRLNIDCVCQNGVNADESLLLDVFALAQEGHEEEAQMLLEGILAPEEAQAGCDHAIALVCSLNSAGHTLPRGAEAVRRHAFCHLMSTAAPAPAGGYLN